MDITFKKPLRTNLEITQNRRTIEGGLDAKTIRPQSQTRPWPDYAMLMFDALPCRSSMTTWETASANLGKLKLYSPEHTKR